MDSFDSQGQEQFLGEVQKLEEIKLCCGIAILLHLIRTHLIDERILECYNQIIEELNKGDLAFYSCLHESIPDILLFIYQKMKADLQNAFLDICCSLHHILSCMSQASDWEVVAFIVGENALESLLKKGIVQKKKKNDLVQEKDEIVMVHDTLKRMITDETNKYSICNIYNKKKAIKGIERYVAYEEGNEVDCEDLDLQHSSL